MAKPEIVSAEEWQQARDDLLKAEKYCTTGRGLDRLMFSHSILDLCPYGRQEAWEDSPPGWPRLP